MRLWHTSLISALPKQQLLGQWRELNSIYKLQNRHILINFVYDYPKSHLYWYSKLAIDEMISRGYKVNLDNFNEYFKDILNGNEELVDICEDDIFHEKMNPRYFDQCYCNLQEKYDCRWNIR